MLLALASVYSLDQDTHIRSEIDAPLSFLDAKLRSPHGGFIEGLPVSFPRRQNPQMHLFEAFIAAFDATRDKSFQQRAGDCLLCLTPITTISRRRSSENISRMTGRAFFLTMLSLVIRRNGFGYSEDLSASVVARRDSIATNFSQQRCVSKMNIPAA